MTTQQTTGLPQGARSRIDDPSDTCTVFEQTCNAGDLEGLVALYERDAVIVERTGALSRGDDAVRAHLEALLSLRPTMTMLASKTVVHEELALNSSWWQCAATAPDGTDIHMESRGNELLRRQPDGRWLVVIDNPWGAG